MTIEIRNPAVPGEVAARYTETEPGDLDGLITRAHQAQANWALVPQPERGAIIARYIDALEARREDIALSITKEMGKPLAEARGEVTKALGEARAMVARAGAPVGEVFPSQLPGTVAYTTRRPRGVILGINPWNFPFSTPMRKAIPALVYGNAIVLKPASLSPGAIDLMAQIASDHLPENIVQAAIGNGALGQALAEHPGVNAISFTGSVGVGKRVAQAAAGHLAEVSLELGGKNPAILNDASDLDAVLDQIMAAAFAVCGQRCTAVSRVIVNRNLERAVVDGLSTRAEAMHPMDGTAQGAQLGPLSSRQQLEDVSAFVARAAAQGAKISAGGKAIKTETGGYFYAPTILSNVTREMEIAREEVFGPVLSVIPYSSIDEALSIANGVSFGLSSCVYSEQAPVIERFVAESESGMLHVNAGSFPENHLPFVGVKDSAMGVGGSNGPSTVQFYTTEHTVYQRAKV
ncbi:aldehyde dehydrogenase [Actibacterium mucosum KCTC 23349]|uniref:Aldehyde dehydrogenase n=1 Tax=Actibacterium mucosum KCTC 23349 TaxID=1454373 RepID=A0A037ZJK7_9RHOB|nr:aldehyde dehydrogenase family protein [Actibacterium mucosum]KAJ56288.1 aldehyde dehydrogenase [Actibacterium mucosum KCTC 23349]